MMLVEETPVPSEALPVGEFREYLRLGTGFADDAEQDAVLEGCLRASLAAVEGRTGKALLSRVFKWTAAAWRDLGRQVLPVAPVGDILEFAIRDRNGTAMAVPAERYRLDWDTHRPALVAVGLVLPTIPVGGAAVVTFEAGFGPLWTDIPADLRQAVLKLAANYYEHRHQPEAGFPAGVMALIERYRNIRLFGGGS